MTQHVTLVGNVTGAPELRFTPTGQPVVSFTVAANERYRDKSGEFVEGDTYFQRVTAWGDLAEHIAASLNRGSRVVMTGRLRTQTYDSKTETGVDGQPLKRYSHDLLADEVAASMRWNDVKIVRAARIESKTGGTDSTEDPWSTAAESLSEPAPF